MAHLVEGWTNGETFEVWMTISNDQTAYFDAIKAAKEVVAEVGGLPPKSRLANLLERKHGDATGRVTDRLPLVLRTLLASALQEVDWDEIAEEIMKRAAEDK